MLKSSPRVALKLSRVLARVLVPIAYCLLATASSVADTPSAAYIFPAGGQRGTTVSFNVGGHYLRDTCAFEMTGPGVDASQQLVRAKKTLWFEGPLIPMPASQAKENYPVDNKGSVAIASNAPLGFRRWRVSTSQGVTTSLKFVVGDLPEIVEEEVDGDPIPTRVQLPVTINGRTFPREDVDIWTFEAKAGTSYTCEVLASRFGSPLDSRLAVYDPKKQLVVENVDGRGVDSFLRFRAAEDGVYQVHIHDVNFSGLQQYVYRLTITDAPYIDQVYPLGGRRGSTTTFELSGQEVPEEPILLSLPDSEAESFAETLQFDGQPTNPFMIELSNLPEALEAEPNNSDTDAGSIQIGSVMNGRIGSPGDADSWWFESQKDDRIEFDLRAARLGSPLDSVLAVVDAAGKELASNDDLQKDQSDSQLKFKTPADGRYRVVLRDQFASRGGKQFAYRLYATIPAEPKPGFELRLPSDALTVTRNGEAKLKITTTRTGGFQDEIALQVEGLPEGVTLVNDKILAKKNDTQLTFKAAENAKIDVEKVRIVGSAKIGETTVTHAATTSKTSPDDITLDQLTLAVAFPTPFKVVGEFETRYAARGSTFLRHYTIDRGGYEGPITIRMGERQARHLQGVTGPTIVVPSGQSEFDYAIKLPPWMEVGRTSRTCVMAVADLPDSKGATHRVSHTSEAQNDQIIVLVDPGQLDVQTDKKSITAKRGTKTPLKVSVGRGQGIEGAVRVQLVVPEHIRGVSAKAFEIPSDLDEGTIHLLFAQETSGPWNMPLVVRATAMKGGHPYTAETTLSVVDAQLSTSPQAPVAKAN
jgi:hypothetical protein